MIKPKDNFDEKLFNYFKNNTKIPMKITEGIHTLNLETPKKKFFDFHNFRKIALATASVVTISTGIVFAKDISSFMKNIFNDNTGVNTAVENGYVHTPNVYTTSQNTKIKITEMIMDDYTLNLNMIADFDKDIIITGAEKIYIPDMIISDNENRILYSPDVQQSISFCQKSGIDSSNENIRNITTNTSSSLFIYNSDANSMNFSIVLSAADEKFPLSKEIHISFSTIEIEINNEKHIISGNWDAQIKVPNKFLNRESILYKAINCNNSNVYTDSIKAEVYETGMNFQMTMYWGDYTTWHEKIEKMRTQSVLSSQLINQENSYVENENGEKFYPAQSTSSDGGYSFNTDGKLIKWETFDLTKFNMTNKLKVVLTTINNEQIIIELEKCN